MKIAICPGSFDPVTMGHHDIITRAAKLFDKVIVVVMSNPQKVPCFSKEERLNMLDKVFKNFPNIEIDYYDGLLADYAKQKKACAIVKGLRAVSDFEYEFQMALTNKKLYPEAETIFLNTSEQNLYLSSSIVKQIVQYGGDVSRFVPPEILDDLKNRYMKGSI